MLGDEAYVMADLDGKAALVVLALLPGKLLAELYAIVAGLPVAVIEGV